MTNDEYGQFNLLRFTSKDELARIVQAFCRLTGLSGGVVSMPEDPKNPPSDERQFAQYRLTSPEVINQYSFCGFVRACTQGNVQCMWSDLREAEAAMSAGKAIHYRCHLGLIDIVAPIKVAGRHVANVYLGEARPPDLDFETLWPRYKALLSEPGQIRQQATKEQLKDAFDGLPIYPEGKIEPLLTLAHVLGELISQRATRQAAVIVALDASQEVGATLNLHSNLSIYLRHAERLLNGNTGSIFLFDEQRDHLVSFALDWGYPDLYEITLDINGVGLLAMCARENLRRYHGDLKDKPDDALPNPTSRAYIVRATSRQEIEALGTPALAGSRDARNLQSIVLVPITNGHELLGVIDIGSSEPGIFSEDDQHVLRLFAREIGVLVKNVKDRRALLDVFGENDPSQLARILAREIPLHVMGDKCSIFLKHGDVATLFATNEFPLEQQDKVEYKVGEGLTGWVLKSGRPLRISAGPKCRTDNLRADLRELGVEWRGKHRDRDSDHLPAAYWEDRPFLAVPVRSARNIISGVIRVSDRKVGSFTESDQSILQAFADCLGQLIRPGDERHRRADLARTKHVFLGYGHDLTGKEALEGFLRTCGLIVETYDVYKQPGKFLYATLMSAIDNSDAAVILYTGDDELKNGGKPVARRNVAYELGVAHRSFGPEGTLLLMEEGVEQPTNVAGIQVVFFEKNSLPKKYAEIRESLAKMRLL